MKLKSKILINIKKIIIYSSLFILVSANTVCKKEELPKIDTTQKNENTSIKFTKQGEVYFQDKSKSLIRKIDVEIAETVETRHLGLMFRDKMEEDQGMLFIFPSEEQQGFYMKNTILPLDIIFINAKKEIIKIYKNTTPFSEKTLPSGKLCLYVVEVNAGYTDKYNIKEGDFIDWRRQ